LITSLEPSDKRRRCFNHHRVSARKQRFRQRDKFLPVAAAPLRSNSTTARSRLEQTVPPGGRKLHPLAPALLHAHFLPPWNAIRRVAHVHRKLHPVSRTNTHGKPARVSLACTDLKISVMNIADRFLSAYSTGDSPSPLSLSLLRPSNQIPPKNTIISHQPAARNAA